MTQSVDSVRVTPRLVIEGVDAAIDYYSKTLGAIQIERYADDEERVVHAAIRIGDFIVSFAEQIEDWGLLGPGRLGGSPILLHLSVPDCDAVGARMVEHGAEVLIPIEDRFYGKREGRLRDPFGHLWIVSTPLDAAPTS